MKKLFLICMLAVSLLAAGVFATVTPVNPAANETTNEDVYDFIATSDNPFHIALPPSDHIDLIFDGAKQMDCTWNATASTYDCGLLSVDISALNGLFSVNMIDNDGNVSVATLTIDQEVIAGDFGFGASGNDVSYTLNCDCDPSGCAVEEAWYSDDDWASHTVATASPENIANGTYKFLGHCEDNAGNKDNSTVVEFTLPASPPVLIGVTELPSTVVCNDAGTCASPLDYGPVDGAGTPLDISLKLAFDKAAAITVTYDAGSPIGPSGAYTEHVMLLNSLTEGVHTLSVLASDGVNADTYVINVNATNTGVGGNVTIDIRDAIPINATTPSIEFLAASVIKNEILPGDFALVNYSLFMVQGEYTRFSFLGDAEFDTPVLVFCEDNFDGSDIINSSDPNVYSIDLLDGSLDETNPAITCPVKSGDISSGLYYDVVVKYPIAANATGGALSGTLDVGLYKNDLYTQCSDGIDNDADLDIDLDDADCVDLDDDDESA